MLFALRHRRHRWGDFYWSLGLGARLGFDTLIVQYNAVNLSPEKFVQGFVLELDYHGESDLIVAAGAHQKIVDRGKRSEFSSPAQACKISMGYVRTGALRWAAAFQLPFQLTPSTGNDVVIR